MAEDEKFIEAKRDYLITTTTLSRCDVCKRFFKFAYDFVPKYKTHNFDNVVVCVECVKRLEGFDFNMEEVLKIVKQGRNFESY